MDTLWLVTFFIGAALQVLLVVRLQRGAYKRYPVLFLYCILLILSTMALPLARVKVQREKERRLREALSEMRTAIDRYKDMADAGKLGQVDPDAHGYPESLEVLVEGVTLSATGSPGGLFNQGQQGQQGQQIPGQPSSGFGGGLGGGSSSRGGFGSSARGGGRGGFGGTGFGSAGGGLGSSSASSGRSNSSSGDGEQKIRFLRRIPTDPITGSADWGLRSVQDDPDSMSWGGQNVFDVYTRSMDRSLDGTPYSEW